MDPSGNDPFSDDLFAQLSTGAADEDLQHLVDSLVDSSLNPKTSLTDPSYNLSKCTCVNWAVNTRPPTRHYLVGSAGLGVE